jgi:hypothetical protein
MNLKGFLAARLFVPKWNELGLLKEIGVSWWTAHRVADKYLISQAVNDHPQPISAATAPPCFRLVWSTLWWVKCSLAATHSAGNFAFRDKAYRANLDETRRSFFFPYSSKTSIAYWMPLERSWYLYFWVFYYSGSFK